MIDATIPKSRLSSEIEESHLEVLQPDTLPKRNSPPQGEAMKCFCRIRACDNKNEIFKIAENTEEKILSVKMDQNVLQKCGGISSFTFSKIFNENSSQIEVYESTCQFLIEDLFKNKKGGLIFTYGMTNAGKTYTVVGKPDNPGILPLSLKSIYENIANIENKPKVSCNFVEVYNEEMFDLLSHDPKNPKFKKKVYIKERDKRFVLQDITHIKIENLDDFSEALNRGISKKAHSATSLNQNSSRSHTIFKIIVSLPIVIRKKEIEYEEISLSIVDLAGSERQNRTEAQGKELQEACKINQSLSVLGKCMEALRHNSLYVNKRIVPFRESKLTMLFQEYFQGDQNVIMVTNINPRREDFEETMRALTYSCVAKEIKPIKSKIVNFTKKREITKIEEDESLTEEKNVCKNLNEIFSDSKSVGLENNLHHLSFSEGRSSFLNYKDDIDLLKSELDNMKKKYEEAINVNTINEKKIDMIINKYEEIRLELSEREQYGRIEAIKEIMSELNRRPALLNGKYQLNNYAEEENIEKEYMFKFNELNINKHLPIGFDKDQGKINILMIQPNFNQLKYICDVLPTKSENFALEPKIESKAVLINITNSNNQVNEKIVNENKIEIEDKKKINKIKKNTKKKKKKDSEQSLLDSFSNNDTSFVSHNNNSEVNSESSENTSFNFEDMKSKKNKYKNKKNNKKKQTFKESFSPIKEIIETSTYLANDDSIYYEREFNLDEKENFDNSIIEEIKINKNKRLPKPGKKQAKSANDSLVEEERTNVKKATRSKNKKTNYKKFY